MQVQLVSDYFDLASHVLSHVPPGGPTPLHHAASLYDERYLLECRRRYDVGATPALARDVSVAHKLWANLSAEALMGVAHLPFLHNDIESFLKCAADSLADCADDAVDDSGALASVRVASGALVEIVRCDMALCASSFSAGWAKWTTQVSLSEYARNLGTAAAVVPALEQFAVWLSTVLGSRGRVRSRNIVVGLGAVGAADDGSTAVAALHECAVAGVSSSQLHVDGWHMVEATAVEALQQVLRRSPLEAAHARWLRRLDVSGLGTADPHAVEATAAWLRGERCVPTR